MKEVLVIMTRAGRGLEESEWYRNTGEEARVQQQKEDTEKIV